MPADSTANDSARAYRQLTRRLAHFLELLSRIDPRTLPAPAADEMARLTEVVRKMHDKYAAFVEAQKRRVHLRGNNRNESLG